MKNIDVINDLAIPMRDGVQLACDIYYREGTLRLPQPIILSRTPYSKNLNLPLDPSLAQRGYILVVQDIRGRYRSGGDFDLFDPINSKDAADTIAWLRWQSYSNGRVGMSGVSYLAVMQFLAAAGSPEGLCAIHPMQGNMPALHIAEGFPSLEMAAILTVLLLADFTQRRGVTIGHSRLREAVARFEENFTVLAPALVEAVSEQPPDELKLEKLKARVVENSQYVSDYCLKGSLRAVFAELRQYAPWVEYFLDEASGKGSEMLSRMDYRSTADKIQAPVLETMGWHEPFIRGALEQFSEARNDPGAQPRRLVVTPTTHINVPGAPIGERLLPLHWPDSPTLLPPQPYPEKYGALGQRWLDHWLKDEEVDILEEPPLQIYVLGRNEWRDEYEWPLARTAWTPMYLDSGGHANTALGDGRLLDELPQYDSRDEFLYNPDNPVPTTGGTLLGLATETGGPRRQNSLHHREDVLFYTSPSLPSEVEVTGPIVLNLWIKSSAPDTDIVVKLIDVEPGGDAWGVTQGMVRLREVLGGVQYDGEIVLLNIELAPISYLFKQSHQIRLQITSSDYPWIDRNPNTGNSLLLTDEMKNAWQTVFHGGEYPSQLILPVIPDASGTAD